MAPVRERWNALCSNPSTRSCAASFRAWLDKEIVPNYLEWEAAGIVPHDVFVEAGKHGFVGMNLPEEYGGGGTDDFRYNQVIDEEIQMAGVGGAGLGMSLHNDICVPYFLAYCTEEQRRAGCPASRRASS